MVGGTINDKIKEKKKKVTINEYELFLWDGRKKEIWSTFMERREYMLNMMKNINPFVHDKMSHFVISGCPRFKVSICSILVVGKSVNHPFFSKFKNRNRTLSWFGYLRNRSVVTGELFDSTEGTEIQ